MHFFGIYAYKNPNNLLLEQGFFHGIFKGDFTVPHTVFTPARLCCEPEKEMHKK